MKKKHIIIIAIAALSAMALYVWQIQTIEEYQVYLHRNYFEYQGYNTENELVTLPFEIMLTDFVADTTTNDGTYKAGILLQPKLNKKPEKIIKKTLAPYQVETYNGYRLYLDEYDYKKETQQLIIVLTVERRRYQLWSSQKKN